MRLIHKLFFLFPIFIFSQKDLNNSTDDYFNFYQKYISDVRPISCPMYPSCSHYAQDVLKEKGFFQGMSLIADRLMRDGSDVNHYDLTFTENGFKILDIPYYKDDSKFIYRRSSYDYAYGDNEWDNKEVSFIKNLINNQFYREALLEINRINFFKPKLNSVELFVNKIICYKALDEYEKAIFEFENSRNIMFKKNSDLVLNISKIFIELDNLPKSLELINNSLKTETEFEIRSNFLELKGYVQAKNGKLNESLTSFNQMKELNIFPKKAENYISIVNQGKNLKQKSPTTAGLLSIIPGAGYYYTGNKQTALTSLVLNSILFYATANNIKNENYGMAALTGIFNLAFYIGNIQGSILRAKKMNKMENDKNLDKIKNSIRF